MCKWVFYTLSMFFVYTTVSSQCFSEVDAGGGHSLGIKSDGSLWAWGENFGGQLGNGTQGFVPVTIPVQITSEMNWEKVSAGSYHSLAIKTDGTLWTWGFNGSDNLGLGTEYPGYVTAPVQIGTASDWLKISAGYDYSLAIKEDGTLWGWGKNNQGQLGNNMPGQTVYEPIQIGNGTSWQSVEAGYNFSFGIKNDGSLWSLNGSADGASQVGEDYYWTEVTCGLDFTLGLKEDGTIWSWGSNWVGQLGNGTYSEVAEPAQIGSDSDWRSVRSGGSSLTSMAIKTDNTLWGWGNNGNGQVGIPGTNTNYPIQITTDTWLDVTLGEAFSLAIKSDGSLYGWGYNGYGQVGNGSTATSITSPELVSNCTLSVEEAILESISIYPNPTKSIISIVSKDAIQFIQVFDYQGRMVSSKSENSPVVVQDFGALQNGIYLVRIQTNIGTVIKKVFKN